MACVIAGVTSSAAVSRGAIPTAGRRGVGCGDALSRPSVFTWSAVAKASRVFVTKRSWMPSFSPPAPPLALFIR